MVILEWLSSSHCTMAGFFTGLVHAGSILFHQEPVSPRVLWLCIHSTGWSCAGKNSTFSQPDMPCFICRWNSCSLGRFLPSPRPEAVLSHPRVKNCLPPGELKRKKWLNHGFSLLENFTESHGRGETRTLRTALQLLQRAQHAPLSAHSQDSVPPHGSSTIRLSQQKCTAPAQHCKEAGCSCSVFYFQQKTAQDNHNLATSKAAKVVMSKSCTWGSKREGREGWTGITTQVTQV